ncbi:hypothetical protein KHP57_23395, partial [Algiphilus sp. NNCM1]|nr:hypothetical protein [Algiphilus acroporae]
DAIDKPITVVFYGDHLPGIYSSASEDDNNSLALHLTDYFIWSNKASSSQGTPSTSRSPWCSTAIICRAFIRPLPKTTTIRLPCI